MNEPPLLPRHTLQQRLRFGIVRMVNTDRNALAAAGRYGRCGFEDRTGQGCLTGVFGSAGNVHRISVLPSRDGNSAADSAAGAGDDGDATVSG